MTPAPDAATPAPVPAREQDPARRLAALAILAAFLLPASAAERGPVLCPVRRVTGLPCPACGLTRSWRAALRGRPVESLRLHPLGIVALGVAAAYAAGLDERLSPATREWLRTARPIAVAGWTATWLVRLVAGTRRR
ncbi:MAG TPA: DUF2752 domain-containing protein [Candidatus Limnocylindrales bacterium]|nr:DUF2752 domain-containing protein [Candidatus Limnocylindrales bacterium]